jgi:hypothetical protein
MPPGWKRVAERGANAAFSSDEISRAIIPALEQDCRAEMSSELIDGVRTLFENQEATLFKDDVRPQLEALKRAAGCGIGRNLLDNVIQLSPHGAAEFDTLARAMTAALIDRAARGARQVEEHYCRKSTAPRAYNTRARIEQSIAESPIEALARQVLKLEVPSSARSTLRQQGLDDGVKL